MEYLFEDYGLTHKAIPEGACEDDDSAEVPFGQAPLHDAGEEDLIIHPLITLPLKDGGILNSFMPGCGTKESIRERCRMNRKALVEQLQYDETEYWREDFEAAWPGVKQKLLDRTIYDGSDVLLRSGSHVPLAMATKFQANARQRKSPREKSPKTRGRPRRTLHVTRRPRTKSAAMAAAPTMPRWRRGNPLHRHRRHRRGNPARHRHRRRPSLQTPLRITASRPR